MTPDPTDTELDEVESDIIGDGELLGSVHPDVALRLIKALRACRKQSKAKDAALERIAAIASDYNEIEGERMSAADVKDVLQTAIAAHDNLPSVAKQGETDDAG